MMTQDEMSAMVNNLGCIVLDLGFAWSTSPVWNRNRCIVANSMQGAIDNARALHNEWLKDNRALYIPNEFLQEAFRLQESMGFDSMQEYEAIRAAIAILETRVLEFSRYDADHVAWQITRHAITHLQNRQRTILGR